MPSGLSGFTTPRSGRRRQLPSSSGRRGFNPLDRVSDIFSPRSPNFSPSSPVLPDDGPDDGASYSDSSASGSVKEPFAEQVERLDQLLATPSQHLGDLALPMSDRDYRSDDDLDDEVEGLESSRRLLAEELSRVEISMLGPSAFDSSDGISGTPESRGRTIRVGETTTSPLSSNTVDGDEDEEDDWVPLLASESHHPPNFSPRAPWKQAAGVAKVPAKDSRLSPKGNWDPHGADSTSFGKHDTVHSGDEYDEYDSPLNTARPTSDTSQEPQEEDRKPEAKNISRSDKKKGILFSSKPSQQKDEYDSPLDEIPSTSGINYLQEDRKPAAKNFPRPKKEKLQPFSSSAIFKPSQQKQDDTEPIYAPKMENTLSGDKYDPPLDETSSTNDINNLQEDRKPAAKNISGLKKERLPPFSSSVIFKPSQQKQDDTDLIYTPKREYTLSGDKYDPPLDETSPTSGISGLQDDRKPAAKTILRLKKEKLQPVYSAIFKPSQQKQDDTELIHTPKRENTSSSDQENSPLDETHPNSGTRVLKEYRKHVEKNSSRPKKKKSQPFSSSTLFKPSQQKDDNEPIHAPMRESTPKPMSDQIKKAAVVTIEDDSKTGNEILVVKDSVGQQRDKERVKYTVVGQSNQEQRALRGDSSPVSFSGERETVGDSKSKKTDSQPMLMGMAEKGQVEQEIRSEVSSPESNFDPFFFATMISTVNSDLYHF